jgi:hypothetical protein
MGTLWILRFELLSISVVRNCNKGFRLHRRLNQIQHLICFDDIIYVLVSNHIRHDLQCYEEIS